MLKDFSITSFRGIEGLTLSFGPKTYIQGVNGSGKTHILDAIHLLSGAVPLYSNSMIETLSVFDGLYLQNNLPRSYRLLQDDKKKTFVIQGSTITKPKYMRALPWRTVYISPFDMNLLYFAPSIRREAMDTTLSGVYEQFGKVKKDYELVMRQRNTLLKRIRDGQGEENELDFWDHKFALLTETYGLYRSKYVKYIQDALLRFPTFFSRYPIQFYYTSSVQRERENIGKMSIPESEIVKGYLQKNRQRDILIGHTNIGLHRDDWGFQVFKNSNVFGAEGYLSRGEMKMLLLGLKLIEAEFITETMNTPVIILIDDIFAELDEYNSEIFLNSLTTYQVILTSQKPLLNHEKHHDFICINLEYS